MNKEDILIITNYYPPEKGAASNRIEQLANQLAKHNYNVNVLCPLANYPNGKVFDQYKGKFVVTERLKQINVIRLWIYPSNSRNILKRILSVFSFVVFLMTFLIFKKTPQKVIVQSPPLLLSFLSVIILALKRKKIILNVSDLWPLAAKELNLLNERSLIYRGSEIIEKLLYKYSSVIIAQSNEIISHVKKIYPLKTVYLYRNYPELKNNLAFNNFKDEKIKIFYAGLLGVAQGMLDICKNINFNGSRIELHIFGDGAENSAIKEYLSTTNKNIIYHGMVDREKLHEMIKGFDFAFVPLKNRIYGSVPSKIFEYAILGYPILYYGGGEGEQIVLNGKLGWNVPVGNVECLNKQLNNISNLSRDEIEILKQQVYEFSTKEFSIIRQIKFLINEKAF